MAARRRGAWAPAAMAAARALLLALAAVPVAVGAGPSGRPLAVLGYVPEYRFGSLDWAHAVASTTHLMLFSVEPSPSGNLVQMDRLRGVLSDGSPLVTAWRAAGADAPKVLVTIGGSGRCRHFADAVGSSKARKKLASTVVSLLEQYPILSGIDLDWQAPETVDHWRDLGNAAKEIRSSVEAAREEKGDGARPLVLTMTYHPRSKAVESFASIKGKKSSMSFVDVFDLVHAMAYTQYDNDRRHSSPQMDDLAINEWLSAGLPRERLALGVPFFGVDRKTGEAKTYSQVLEQEPSLQYRLGEDHLQDGRTYFVGPRSLAKKVFAARAKGIAGVTIWEIGQDAPPGTDLLQHVWAAARFGKEPERSWRESVLSRTGALRGDHGFAGISAFIGVWLLARVFTVEYARDRFQPPPRKARVAESRGEAADAPNGARGGAGAAPNKDDAEKKED